MKALLNLIKIANPHLYLMIKIVMPEHYGFFVILSTLSWKIFSCNNKSYKALKHPGLEDAYYWCSEFY